jgi:elongation factor G
MSPDSEPTHDQAIGHVQTGQASSANNRSEAARGKGLRTEQIRNIALAGHAGAGKTLLLEALLLAAGAIDSAGSIDHGNTVSDTDAQEKSRAHSIDSCVAHLEHGGCHLNLIDTAGHAEFLGGTLSALAAVETVAVVVNAINGIEHGTREL